MKEKFIMVKRLRILSSSIFCYFPAETKKITDPRNPKTEFEIVIKTKIRDETNVIVFDTEQERDHALDLLDIDMRMI